MITNCKTKTITLIDDGKITISCLFSENQNEVDKPTIFECDLLEKEIIVNETPGVEGELILLHTDSSDVVGKINENGNLLITLEDDDVEKYYVDNQNLMYDGEQDS